MSDRTSTDEPPIDVVREFGADLNDYATHLDAGLRDRFDFSTGDVAKGAGDQPRDSRGRWTSGTTAELPSRGDQEAGAEALREFASYAADVGGGPDKIVANHGRAYHFDADSFSGTRATQGRCYQQAAMAAMGGRGTYVEGYVGVHGVPVHHAWTVDADGRVSDPTLRSHDAITGYFGVPLSVDYVRQTAMRTRVWGVLSHTNPTLMTASPDEYLAKFDATQPRDDRGRWAGGAETDRPTLDHLFADNLGIRRADMPQVPQALQQKFVDELRSSGVDVREETVPARSLRATQSNYNPVAVEHVRAGWNSGVPADGARGSVRDFATTVSSDGRVLDGHHRWAVAAQQGDDLKTIRVDLPMTELLARARDFNSRYHVEARKFADPTFEKFDPNQERDDHGRWTGGGASTASTSDPGAHPRAPAARDYASIRDDQGRTLGDLLKSGAPRSALDAHPAMSEAIKDSLALPHTENYPGYGTQEFRDDREFVDGRGNSFRGYDAASDKLFDVARAYAGPGGVRNEKQAWIMLGLPASGKSTYAERVAGERGAAIVDPDDAKKMFREFGTGIGANAVHEESGLLSGSVLKRFTEVGANVIIPKVGGSAGSIQRLTTALKSQGYEVHLGLKDAEPDGAYVRMVNRFLQTGRLISGRYIDDVDHNPGRVFREIAGSGEYASTEVQPWK